MGKETHRAEKLPDSRRMKVSMIACGHEELPNGTPGDHGRQN